MRIFQQHFKKNVEFLDCFTVYSARSPFCKKGKHRHGGRRCTVSNKNTERIQDLALSNEVQCEIVNDEGNEAKVFSSFTDKIDLSIVSQTSQSNWQGKKIAEFILQNAKSSVLYIPN